VVDLIEKYGVVPVEVMPETYASSHTGGLNKLVTRKLRQFAARLRQMHQEGAGPAQLRSEKEAMLATVYGMLALHFGEPPRDFTWRYETADSVVSEPSRYTPRAFYQEMIDLALPDYVSIFDYPGKEYYQLYQIEHSRNIHDRENVTFLNLPIDSLKRYSLTSVLADEPVWFACDVGKSHYGDKGILREGIYDFASVYGTDFELEKRRRLELRDSKPNHAMVFTGVDTAAGVAGKWKVENSWGKDRGDGGYWTLYDDWFNEYVYIVIVDRKYLTAETLAILERKPKLLPAWDPMWEFARGAFSPPD
jgi:bleomycin hydrolase